MAQRRCVCGGAGGSGTGEWEAGMCVLRGSSSVMSPGVCRAHLPIGWACRCREQEEFASWGERSWNVQRCAAAGSPCPSAPSILRSLRFACKAAFPPRQLQVQAQPQPHCDGGRDKSRCRAMSPPVVLSPGWTLRPFPGSSFVLSLCHPQSPRGPAVPESDPAAQRWGGRNGPC